MRFLLFTAVLFLFVALSTPQQAHAQQSIYGRPARLRDLTDLDLATTSDLTAPQKTEVILSWLVEERNNPHLTTRGMGGGPIDTDYIQAQLVKDMEVWGDPAAVSWVLSSTSLKDEGLRDAMSLVLGSMGDQSQIPKIENILLNNTNPYLRAIAAEDIGILGSAKSMKALEKASQDQFSLTFASEANEGKITTFYPVRQVAGEVLRVLRDPVLLSRKMAHEQMFVQRLTSARLYAREHGLKPDRFIKIAQRSKAAAVSVKG